MGPPFHPATIQAAAWSLPTIQAGIDRRQRSPGLPKQNRGSSQKLKFYLTIPRYCYLLSLVRSNFSKLNLLK